MNRQSLSALPGIVLCLAAAAIFVSSGCASSSKKDKAPPPSTGSEFSDAGATVATEEVEEVDVVEWVDLGNVYFDFDRSDIRRDAVPTLKQAAVSLNDTGLKVIIEGNTDNRGTEEYNLALGERRASSVRRYLANLGVPMGQMTIVSFGELRPAAQGNTEAAWALNRRVQFEPAD
jgi:peptidoglycan-associated lipoprotein